MRYRDYDESLTSKGFLQEHDKINVFINLETVFKHLSMIPDLEKKLVLQRDFETILVSNILNLAGHYKRFFVGNNLDTRVYLYHTDFKSSEFPQYKYNEDFRTYYLVKYNDNPKFVFLTDALKRSILPDVKVYCEFIPRVYYISSKDIEGSLVPYIIASEDTTRKNLIIGGEFYDTQYSLIPNFINHYIHKGPGYSSVCSSVDEYILDMTKKPKDEMREFITTFSSYSTYCSLLSVIGDRQRSIDGLTGIGPKTLEKLILGGIEQNIIQMSTTNPSMIGDIFHDDDVKEEFMNNYYCISVMDMYQELTSADKMSIYNQRKDRFDINSLVSLNKTRFANHPLILEALTL